MPGKTVEAKFKASGTAKMERQLRGIERELKGVRKAGAGLKEGMAKGGLAVGAAIVGFGAMKAAAQAAAAAVGELTRVMKGLSDRGADLSAVTARFEQLASPELVANMQRATGQLVNSFDLMRASNVALGNEMLTEEQWTRWSAMVTRAAQDTGRDVTTSINQLSQAFTGGGVEFLGQLGIEMGGVKDSVREMGLSMESAEGRMAALALAGDQLEASYDGIDNSAGNSGDALQQVTVVLENFRDAVAEAFAEDEQLIESLVGLADQLRPMIPMAVDAGKAIAEMAVAMIRVAIEAAPMIVSALQGTLRVFEVLVQAHADVMGAVGRENTGWNQLADSLRTMRYRAGDLSEAFVRLGRAAVAAGEQAGGVWDEIPQVWEETTPLRRPQRRRRGGGGGPSRPEKTDDKNLTLAMSGEQNMRSLMDSAASGLSVINDLYTEIFTLQEEMDIAGVERHELMMEELEAEKQAELAALETIRLKQEEVAQAALNRIRDQANATAEWGSVGAGSISMIGDAVGQLAAKKQRDLDVQRQSMREMGKSEAEIKAATQDREKAVKRMQKAEGAFLVAYNVAMAAVEVARAIGSIPNPITIASHAAAAVAHGVAASIAAAKLGGGGGGGSASVSAAIPTVASFTPADSGAMEMPVAEDPKQTNVVNYYSLGRSGEDLGRALREADYEFERADGRASVGAGVSYS